MIKDHVHIELNHEITAIGGHYALTKEVRLPFQGRDVLYLVGYAVLDNACCGVGGLGYALVPGFIVSWRSKVNRDGLAVSEVEPIQDKALQDEIRQLIAKQEAVSQVLFE